KSWFRPTVLQKSESRSQYSKSKEQLIRPKRSRHPREPLKHPNPKWSENWKNRSKKVRLQFQQIRTDFILRLSNQLQKQKEFRARNAIRSADRGWKEE